jgi:hypothetical protein
MERWKGQIGRQVDKEGGRRERERKKVKVQMGVALV